MDDGPADLAASRDMAEGLYRLGFRQVFATPHLPWATPTVNVRAFRQQGEALIEDLAKLKTGLKIGLAAEHYSDLVPELLQGDDLILFPRRDTFLMEFPHGGFPARLQDLLFMAQVKKRIPVIAHVERYPEVQKDIQVLNLLKERGCYLLVNVSSLAGAWTRAAQSAAKAVLRADLADAVNSDLHHAKQIDLLEEGFGVLRELVGDAKFQQLTQENPAKIAGVEEDGLPGQVDS